MSTVMSDLKDSILTEIQSELGSSYKELAYIENIDKNSFLTSNDRFGVRALTAIQQPGVTKYTTFSQSFEIVLTKGYIQSSIDDTEQVNKSYELRASMLDIYQRLVNNKAGAPSLVMNIFNLVIQDPEYLDEDKVVIIRATMDIFYRIIL